jgi:hypothetical protein
MAKFQFRKRKKLAPGLYLNISKKGFGLSAGPKGAKISRSATGRITGSLGIPGSGISYRKRLNKQNSGASNFNERANYNIGQNAQDRSAYIAIHGNVLTSSEIRKSLFYLFCLILVSLVIPITMFNGESLSTSISLWILFAFLYIRETSRNKRKWRERTEKHLKDCNHNPDIPE